MKKIVLFGAKEFEKRLKYYIDIYTEDEVVAFCVDKEFKETDFFCDKPVITTDEMEYLFPPAEFLALVGIGYKNMNNLRKLKYHELSQKGYDFYNLIHPTSFIDKSVQIGTGNIILANTCIDYNACIGNCNIVEVATSISHECQVGDFNYFSPGTVCGGKVCIENNCFLGLNSTIRSAVHIKEYSLIGAGCYLDKNTEEYGVYVPNKMKKLDKKSTDMQIIYRGENMK